MKDGPSHLLYEDYRDPLKRKGTVKGQTYDGTTDKKEYRAYKQALYCLNKELWRTKRDDGEPLKEGDVVCPGLKSTEDHKWTEDDYTFKEYKPEPSIAFYKSKIESANWINGMKINKKLEKILTGKDFPFGYRQE